MIGFELYKYKYIYYVGGHLRVCVLYVVKEVTSFPGLSQLMGVVRKIMRPQALQTSRKKVV